METKTLTLNFVWNFRLRLWAEGGRIWAEGNKLKAESNRLWADAILEVYGNIELKWQWREEKNDSACVLETGETFEP